MVDGGWWVVCKPILVFSLSLGQAEQNEPGMFTNILGDKLTNALEDMFTTISSDMFTNLGGDMVKNIYGDMFTNLRADMVKIYVDWFS